MNPGDEAARPRPLLPSPTEMSRGPSMNGAVASGVPQLRCSGRGFFMQREIFVRVGPTEVGVGIVENRELVEYLVERSDSKHIVGDIYKGVVKAVLPGIQAAFVDIGFEKAGFLHVSDLANAELGQDRIEALEGDGEQQRGRGGGRSAGRGRRDRGSLPPIESLLKKAL